MAQDALSHSADSGWKRRHRRADSLFRNWIL